MSNIVQSRIDTWTGIRAIAAVWVILFHLSNFNMTLDYGGLTSFLGRGELAVDLFFMLSGMVISYVHQAEFMVWNTQRACRFWVLRFARIYPLHLLMLLAMAALGGIEFFYSWWFCGHAPFHQPNSIQDFGLSLLNIHDWETTSKLSFNFPSWSVSAEWFAYLLFPVVTLLFVRLRSPWLNLALITGCLASLYALCAFTHEQQIGFTYHWGLVRVSTEFAIGCCLYNLLKSQKAPLPGVNFLALASLVLIPILISQKVHEIWVVADIGLFIYLLSQVTGWFKAIFANRVMVFGGEISYAMYMVHGFILHVISDTCVFYFHHQQWSLLETAGLVALSLGLVILAAAALNRYVEIPARYAIRQAWQARFKAVRPRVETLDEAKVC